MTGGHHQFGDGTGPKQIILSVAHMGVSKNNGTPKSSILIGFSIMNQPFWGTPIFGNTHIPALRDMLFSMCLRSMHAWCENILGSPRKPEMIARQMKRKSSERIFS